MTKQLKRFASLLLITVMLAGCSSKDDNDNVDCNVPSNFVLVDYISLVRVELGWDADDAVSAWEVEYGLTGFTQGEGTIEETDTNSITIRGLVFNAEYDFYLRSACDGSTSDWTGPVSNTSGNSPSSHALMTANIKGVQYNNLVPYLWSLFPDNAVLVRYFSGQDEPYIQIQGNSEPSATTFENTKEINLFIPERAWSPGTYNLGTDYEVNGIPQPNVNLVYSDNNEPTAQAFEGDFGTITVTEFNTTTRVIKGTFEFTFELYYTAGGIGGPFQCLNGTFDYSLDDEFFD